MSRDETEAVAVYMRLALQQVSFCCSDLRHRVLAPRSTWIAPDRATTYWLLLVHDVIHRRK